MEKQRYKNRRHLYKQWRTSEDGREWVVMLRKKQSNLCFICTFELGTVVHIDHIKPLYADGTNNARNLALTHPKCNLSKGISELLGKGEIDFRRDLFYKIRRGLQFYGQVKAGQKVKSPHAFEMIELASQYVDLAMVK